MNHRFLQLSVAILTGSLLFFSQSCNKDKVEPGLPELTTAAASGITLNSAQSGGVITSDGGAAITARGICWGVLPGPTVENDKTTDGTGSGKFTSTLTNLEPGKTYLVRAYATNSIGTAYGNEISFTASTQTATLTTVLITDIANNSATSGGNITFDGGSAITARGVVWSTTANPTLANDTTQNGTGTGVFASHLTGLYRGTLYHVRAYATNGSGTSYGNELTFTTTATGPTLTTTAISNITHNSVSTGGNITADGGATITSRGVVWGTSPAPTTATDSTSDGSGIGQYVSTLSGLTPNTLYYVRAFATTSEGTTYGNEVTFTTLVGQITLTPIKDTSIFANISGGGTNSAYGNGASELLMIGYTSSGAVYARSMVQFDFSSMPANTTIDNVTLSLLNGASGTAALTIYVHPVTEAWSEGSVNIGCAYNAATCPTIGAALTAGFTDATWINAISGANVTPWTTLGGGTYPPANASASAAAIASPVSLTTAISFNSTQLTNDVKGWIANASTNYGWVLKVDEPNVTAAASLKRYVSRDANGATVDQKPKLVINFH